MIKRLRMKFICINMTVITAMLLVIFGLVLHFTAENLRQQSLTMLQSVSENTRHPIGSWEGRREAQLPYFSVSVNLLGQVSATVGGHYDLPDSQTVEKILALALAEGDSVGYLKEYRLRYQKSATPFGQKLVFVDVSSEISTLEDLAEACVFIALLSLTLFLGLSILLARWAIRPVEAAWKEQRQFVADASHELKTPLTVILTNAELLQSPQYTDAERSQFVSSILAMSLQMRGLVESLLELARVDNGTGKMAFSELSFSRLLQDSLLPFEPVYFEKGLILESDIQEDLFLRGNATHLRQVVDILLDNASKYTAPGGTVRVILRRQGSHCRLWVTNPGEALSPEELTNIFQRFYRVDKARAMNHSYGLGLPIAQSIVTRHGGRIWAESNGGINAFCVQLPSL